MKKPLYKVLYVQVLAAIVIGVLLGFFFPDIGASMKPLGDGFIKLIKMLIAPVIFCTVVIGIAGMEDMKKVGKVGGLALLYFEAVTTLALFVGLFLVNILQPGAGMHVDPATLDMNSVSMYATAGKAPVDFGLSVSYHSLLRCRGLCAGRHSPSLVLLDHFRLCPPVLGRLPSPSLRTY